MIFELPVDHFPLTARSAPSERFTRSIPFSIPFKTASCKDMTTALQESPSVSRNQFHFGKSATLSAMPRRLATSELRLPRVSISMPPVNRVQPAEEPRRPPTTFPQRLANAFSLNSLSC